MAVWSAQKTKVMKLSTSSSGEGEDWGRTQYMAFKGKEVVVLHPHLAHGLRQVQQIFHIATTRSCRMNGVEAMIVSSLATVLRAHKQGRLTKP